MNNLKAFFLCLMFVSPTLSAQQDTAQDATRNTGGKETTAEAIQLIRVLEKHLSGKSRLSYETQLTSDVVLDNGQKIQLAGSTQIYFKRPNQLFVELKTDRSHRLFYHDGNQLTIIAPDENYYGMVEAKTSSIEALMRAAQEYGIEIPMVDLIAWGVKGREWLNVESAVYVGETELQGKTVDHWAIRGAKLDWELWVTQDQDPLPLKISTVRYHATSQPRFTATIQWNDRSSMQDSLFVPKIDKHLRQVPFLQLKPAAGVDATEAETNTEKETE